MKRCVFFISDRTGITAEMLSHSLLTQFEGVEFVEHSIPFVDSIDKAHKVVERINRVAREDGCSPILFTTLIQEEIRAIIADSEGIMFDFFEAFIKPLEEELGTHSNHAIGRSHGQGVYTTYKARIDAVNYALNNDDGAQLRHYPKADLILVGVSRSGKTPTCLFIALHYGILVANYPLTEDDLETTKLPEVLLPYRDKLFGLTINPERLSQIRAERRPNSQYANLGQCQSEIRKAESMMRVNNIPYLDTSAVSIEEIATTILHRTGLKRRLFG